MFGNFFSKTAITAIIANVIGAIAGIVFIGGIVASFIDHSWMPFVWCSCGALVLMVIAIFVGIRAMKTFGREAQQTLNDFGKTMSEEKKSDDLERHKRHNPFG